MKYRDFLMELVQQQQAKGIKPHNVTVEEMATWIIENSKFGDLISVIRNDDFVKVPLRRKYKGETSINRIETADTMASLANFFQSVQHVTEAESIFNEILARTPYDTTALNDYGLQLLKKGRQDGEMMIVEKKNFRLGQEKIFLAAEIDRCLHEDPHLMPAYQNICVIRAMEAGIYLRNKETFTAFVLAWMSIEMSIYRIWYKFLKNLHSSKEKIDSLMKWRFESIAEACYLAKVDPEFMPLKPDLDTLRGIRNCLLHGDIIQVTTGHAARCIEIADKLTHIS